MVYHNSKELLSEVRRIMDLNDIKQKELCAAMGKSQQSISQIFANANPKCDTLFSLCKALNVEMGNTLKKNRLVQISY